MDNIVALYTSADGRIGRRTWWLASIALVVVVVVLELILAAVLGISFMPNLAAADPNADAAALSAQIADSMHKSSWLSLIFFVIFLIPIYALGMKRRHDRDNNGLDLIVYLALTVLMMLLQALGIGYVEATVGTVTVPMPGPIILGLNGIMIIYAIYLLVVMGFLKGTTGPNQYGPDPLTTGAAVPA